MDTERMSDQLLNFLAEHGADIQNVLKALEKAADQEGVIVAIREDVYEALKELSAIVKNLEDQKK